MEEQKNLHHVPHTKKWFEYVLEFLMLFLAVYLGFVAENIREQLVEKSREKQYMIEMVDNLKYDVVRCDKNTANNVEIVKDLDSLREEIKTAISGKINDNKLYYFRMKYGADYSHAVFNKSALTELRSSGSLRLLSDRKLVTAITDYYDRRLSSADTYAPDDKMLRLRNMYDDFFSLANFGDLIKNNKKDSTFFTVYNYNQILNTRPALRLMKSSKSDLQQLYNATAEFELGVNNYLFYLAYVKEGATALHAEIIKAYHMKGKQTTIEN